MGEGEGAVDARVHHIGLVGQRVRNVRGGLALGELVLERGIGGVQPVAQPGQRFLAAVEKARLVRGCHRLRAVACDPREGGPRLQRRGEDQLVVLPRGGLGQGEQLRNHVALALGDGHDRTRPAALLGDHGGERAWWHGPASGPRTSRPGSGSCSSACGPRVRVRPRGAPACWRPWRRRRRRPRWPPAPGCGGTGHRPVPATPGPAPLRRTTSPGDGGGRLAGLGRHAAAGDGGGGQHGHDRSGAPQPLQRVDRCGNGLLGGAAWVSALRVNRRRFDNGDRCRGCGGLPGFAAGSGLGLRAAGKVAAAGPNHRLNRRCRHRDGCRTWA